MRLIEEWRLAACATVVAAATNGVLGHPVQSGLQLSEQAMACILLAAATIAPPLRRFCYRHAPRF